MKIEALNCPNCGAGALSDSILCDFCQSRLKTVACSSCYGLMFLGSNHCSHCGKKTLPVESGTKGKRGLCPRCKIELNMLHIGDLALGECQQCGGWWSDAETFENICAEKEIQGHVLFFVENKQFPKQTIPINYVPCPDCKNLMNRNNFARSSGVILDICKQHGVWFDAEELPKIIEFIRQGGLRQARQKEKLQLHDQKRELANQQRKIALENRRFQQANLAWDQSPSLSIREFIKILFD